MTRDQALPRLTTRLLLSVLAGVLVLATAVLWSAGVASADPGNSQDKNERAQDGKNARTTTPTTEPQPESNADDNETGANQDGPYDSTRDGSPSQNGKGDGQANGKPCAGCVGKADNKNPPGQMPGGSDHNKGYECDENQGVGKTNPAHTGCTESSTPTPEPSTPPVTEPPGGGGGGGGGEPPTGENAPPADSTQGSSLPDTGLPILLLPLAAGLIGAGAATHAIARRRR